MKTRPLYPHATNAHSSFFSNNQSTTTSVVHHSLLQKHTTPSLVHSNWFIHPPNTMKSSLVLLTTLVPPAVAVIYKPFLSYEGNNFLDAFDFYTGDDPTHGKKPYSSKASLFTTANMHTDILPFNPMFHQLNVTNRTDLWID